MLKSMPGKPRPSTVQEWHSPQLHGRQAVQQQLLVRVQQLGQHAQQRLEAGRRRGVGNVRGGCGVQANRRQLLKTSSMRGEHLQTSVSPCHDWRAQTHCSASLQTGQCLLLKQEPLIAPAPWPGHLPRSASPPALAAGLAAAAPAMKRDGGMGSKGTSSRSVPHSGLAAGLNGLHWLSRQQCFNASPSVALRAAAAP